MIMFRLFQKIQLINFHAFILGIIKQRWTAMSLHRF